MQFSLNSVILHSTDPMALLVAPQLTLLVSRLSAHHRPPLHTLAFQINSLCKLKQFPNANLHSELHIVNTEEYSCGRSSALCLQDYIPFEFLYKGSLLKNISSLFVYSLPQVLAPESAFQ